MLNIIDLQQQKLLELTSLNQYNQQTYESTIVEIIRAYQPIDRNQAKYQKSTIVEIIRAYQPKLKTNADASNLQQQKLLELTSRWQFNQSRCSYLQQQKLLELTSPQIYVNLFVSIYNSRNYQSLLALAEVKAERHKIYNSRNYQSLLAKSNIKIIKLYLQQQKLLELTSRVEDLEVTFASTIVEIIRAYQPFGKTFGGIVNLQQQKLLELTSRQGRKNNTRHLQQQKLLELTSQKGCLCRGKSNLQQQKLLELTSRIDNRKVIDGAIYNSRNYQSLLAISNRLIICRRSTIVEIIRAYQPLVDCKDTEN